MVFNGTTLNGAFFRKHELQTAAALYLYCKNADGTYADAELIGEIILDMRKLAGPALPCQGIEIFLRDSTDTQHQEAWREIQDNDVEWRRKAAIAYWTWRNKKTELVKRLANDKKLEVRVAVEDYDNFLKEVGAESGGQGSEGGHEGTA